MSAETIETTQWWEKYSSDAETCETHRIELFVRSLTPSQGTHDSRKWMLYRLEGMVESDFLDSYDINVVGEGMCLCESCLDTRLARHMYETLTTLRDGGDATVEPLGFSERTIDSSLTDEQYSVLTPPEISLAVYVDDTLRGVFPATVDGKRVTVTDYFDAISTLQTRQTSNRAEA